MKGGSMATSVPKELPAIVDFFKTLGERDEIRKELEAAIAEHEQQLQGQRKEAEELRAEKQALLSVIRELMGQLEDLAAAVPSKAQALEMRLGDLRREVASQTEQLRRMEDYSRSIKEQISDGETRLRNLKAQIAGAEDMARARSFAPMPSMTGPVIISPNTLADYDPREPSEEVAS
jgi:chromosome segregation ATPase